MSETKIDNSSETIVLKVMKLVKALPQDYLAEITGRQLRDVAISFDATYRDALRSPSSEKLSSLEKLADETLYWLESVIGSEFISKEIFLEMEKDVDYIIENLVRLVKEFRSNLAQSPDSNKVNKAA